MLRNVGNCGDRPGSAKGRTPNKWYCVYKIMTSFLPKSFPGFLCLVISMGELPKAYKQCNISSRK